LLTKITTQTTTSLTITLPSPILCSNYNNISTISSSWNYQLNTSTSNSIGNILNLQLQLGNCYIRYFTGSIVIRVVEALNGVTSTISNILISNICGDKCYECSSNLCTSCFNNTNSNYILFYKNSCLNTCPSRSYL